MNNLSMTQALSIWSDLEAAYHGRGGNVAEIYTYRLMEHDPWYADKEADVFAGKISPWAGEALDRAHASLYNLLVHFLKLHEDVKIIVGQLELGAWLLTARNPYRFHIQMRRGHE